MTLQVARIDSFGALEGPRFQLEVVRVNLERWGFLLTDKEGAIDSTLLDASPEALRTMAEKIIVALNERASN